MAIHFNTHVIVLTHQIQQIIWDTKTKGFGLGLDDIKLLFLTLIMKLMPFWGLFLGERPLVSLFMMAEGYASHSSEDWTNCFIVACKERRAKVMPFLCYLDWKVSHEAITCLSTFGDHVLSRSINNLDLGPYNYNLDLQIFPYMESKNKNWSIYNMSFKLCLEYVITSGIVVLCSAGQWDWYENERSRLRDYEQKMLY